MASEDTYRTLKTTAEGLFKDRGSKFIAFATPVHSEEDIKNEQERIRQLHSSARHHCYAWRLGRKDYRYRANDDGEPANSAGAPILGQLQSYELTNLLIIVVRYFGGVKLGVGGLINAYRKAAADAIDTGTIVERIVMQSYTVAFPYNKMSAVMGLIKREQLEQSHQNFDLSCSLQLEVRLSDASKIEEQLNLLEGVSATPL